MTFEDMSLFLLPHTDIPLYATIAYIWNAYNFNVMYDIFLHKQKYLFLKKKKKSKS